MLKGCFDMNLRLSSSSLSSFVKSPQFQGSRYPENESIQDMFTRLSKSKRLGNRFDAAHLIPLLDTEEEKIVAINQLLSQKNYPPPFVKRAFAKFQDIPAAVLAIASLSSDQEKMKLVEKVCSDPKLLGVCVDPKDLENYEALSKNPIISVLGINNYPVPNPTYLFRKIHESLNSNVRQDNFIAYLCNPERAKSPLGLKYVIPAGAELLWASRESTVHSRERQLAICDGLLEDSQFFDSLDEETQRRVKSCKDPEAFNILLSAISSFAAPEEK